MKNLILFISILFVAFGANAQCGLPYKPFSDFKDDPTLLNDTLSYLEYNINERRKCHIGKSIGNLVSEIEFPVRAFKVTYDNSEYVPRIDLLLSDYDYTQKKYRNEFRYHGITIYFDKQIDYHLLKKLIEKYPEDKWVPKHYDFFKDLIIKALSSNDMKRISLESEYYNRLHEKYGKDFNESMIELK